MNPIAAAGKTSFTARALLVSQPAHGPALAEFG